MLDNTKLIEILKARYRFLESRIFSALDLSVLSRDAKNQAIMAIARIRLLDMIMIVFCPSMPSTKTIALRIRN